ncbi:MAG: hypothetical protein ACSHYC_23890 [Alphaproteobacteria bacterium]
MAREKCYFEEMKAVGDADPTGQVYRHFDVLSGRTSSLLSHISIMIAVTAFMLSMAYPKGTPLDIFGIFLTVELAAYSALTIPVLSITFVTNSMTSSRYGERPEPSETDKVLEKYLMVFHTRRAYFYFSFITLNILNVLFVITVSAKFLSRVF